MTPTTTAAAVTGAGGAGATTIDRDALWEELFDLTVDVVLAYRAQYLESWANVLEHWNQIASRMQMATRTSSGPEEWCSKFARGLKITTPSRDASRAMVRLAEKVAAYGRGPWGARVQTEHAFILARARVEAEERKAAREARAATTDSTDSTDTTTDSSTPTE